MRNGDTYERVGIAGGGAMATGLAAVASAIDDVILLARDEDAAARAEERAARACARYEQGDPERIFHTTDLLDLTGCDLIIEAVVEELDVKGELLEELAEACHGADLATTTSSLSIAELGERSGAPDRFYGLHAFNPVTHMKLVELCFSSQTSQMTRTRAHEWCKRIGKKTVEVPDHSGFVVNRLLFPYLFDAVRYMNSVQMRAADIDACMTMGAGHPMGPLALLDFVGIDVAVSIGEELHRETEEPNHKPPDTLYRMIEEGKLGRKRGGGFFDYG